MFDYIVSNFNCQEAFSVYILQCFSLDFGRRILISLVLNKKIENMNMKTEKSNQNKPSAYEMLFSVSSTDSVLPNYYYIFKTTGKVKCVVT